MNQLKILITGNVQGVFFRASTKKVADELGVVGTVRNNSDGSVEVIGQGNEKQLEKLIAFCKKGPEHARVDDVLVEREEMKTMFDSFRVVR